jgi:hypothetical protein
VKKQLHIRCQHLHVSAPVCHHQGAHHQQQQQTSVGPTSVSGAIRRHLYHKDKGLQTLKLRWHNNSTCAVQYTAMSLHCYTVTAVCSSCAAEACDVSHVRGHSVHYVLYPVCCFFNNKRNIVRENPAYTSLSCWGNLRTKRFCVI